MRHWNTSNESINAMVVVVRGPQTYIGSVEGLNTMIISEFDVLERFLLVTDDPVRPLGRSVRHAS